MHFNFPSPPKREREVQKVRRRTSANELIPFVSNYKHFVDFVFLVRLDTRHKNEWHKVDGATKKLENFSVLFSSDYYLFFLFILIAYSCLAFYDPRKKKQKFCLTWFLTSQRLIVIVTVREKLAVEE